MAATHSTTRRTRKTSTRTRRRRQLPALGWGWAGVALVIIGIAKTWPIWTGIAVALIAAIAILRAIRPRRLNRLWRALEQLAERRRALPARTRGQRTLQTFQNMTAARFEQAIAELALEDPRVHSAHTVGGANDRGADVLVHLHDGRRILIQCKKYRPGNNVGSQTVQTINGVYRDIHHCHAAVIVTTAGFTRDAIDTNARFPQPIRLIDGHALTAWANGGTPPWQ